VVTMQVRDQHRPDGIRINPEPSHGDQRRGATID
jgi:hypothetical protein